MCVLFALERSRSFVVAGSTFLPWKRRMFSFFGRFGFFGFGLEFWGLTKAFLPVAFSPESDPDADPDPDPDSDPDPELLFEPDSEPEEPSEPSLSEEEPSSSSEDLFLGLLMKVVDLFVIGEGFFDGTTVFSVIVLDF